MSWLWLLAQGAVIGFVMAVPVGPIGVLCIRRSLHDGWAVGLVYGLGAASADALYGAVAGFGLASVTGLLDAHQGLVRLVGGVFLLVLGLRVLRAGPQPATGGNGGRRLLRGYASCFLLALTNPGTMFAFVAVFASIGPGLRLEGYDAIAILVAGVFLGSALWWLTLSAVANRYRDRLSLAGLAWVNRVSGILILILGLAALAAFSGLIEV